MKYKHQIKVSSKSGRSKAARKWRRQSKQALRQSDIPKLSGYYGKRYTPLKGSKLVYSTKDKS